MEIYADLGTLGIFNYRIPPLFPVFLITEYPPMKIYADLGTLGIFNYRIPPPMEIYADLGTLGIFNYRIPPLQGSTHTHTYTMPSHTHILCHLVCIVGEIILHCG